MISGKKTLLKKISNKVTSLILYTHACLFFNNKLRAANNEINLRINQSSNINKSSSVMEKSKKKHQELCKQIFQESHKKYKIESENDKSKECIRVFSKQKKCIKTYNGLEDSLENETNENTTSSAEHKKSEAPKELPYKFIIIKGDNINMPTSFKKLTKENVKQIISSYFIPNLKINYNESVFNEEIKKDLMCILTGKNEKSKASCKNNSLYIHIQDVSVILFDKKAYFNVFLKFYSGKNFIYEIKITKNIDKITENSVEKELHEISKHISKKLLEFIK
ncbi:hypothetical protein [Candidatus Nesciobacter abundans]|uniref:Uncharacterized protein n=1 Tax=Candidatus Nesciobacter abundans TaxID=2601668 RepID=A0A5C0UH77_9PROT|nr:hypothetical protein [Candidatus Nesciobacter abundans]QEK39067.1 hypothetical protein FZC36_01285 [Candidatus Nesciobacter abundans]